jgi:hypothetical protein
MSESGAHWANVEILPADEHVSLPTDKSGSHYFAARDTDSACLSVPSPMPAKSAAEQEKFIFYRGAGSFSTPLTVTMNSANSVTITNTGSEPLAELFVLDLQNRAGRYIHLDRLAPGEKRTVLLDSPKPSVAMDVLSSQIEKEMAKALAGQGLYEREATAMVNTWKDSWFAEDGLRVLYILPRQWTDRTLPLTLKPAPRELVRVMVGRAEVLTPSLQQNLSVALIKTHQGDTAARAHVIAELKALGRFAEPALRLATAKLDKATVQGAWTLYNTTFVSATTKVATASPFE